MSGDEEVMAAMGFASFGQPRRERRRVKQETSARTEALPQLMPGTELATQQVQCSAGSVDVGPHGVLYLLCKEKGTDAHSFLDAALHEDAKEDKQEDQVPYAASQEELEREKQKFDTLESSQFVSARAATNKFETLGRHRFLNRSAMKLVTLDYIFQWTQELEQRQEPFTFADICGGPGGFSEYLLWRVGQGSCGLKDEGENARRVHGYGITLKGAANNCGWRLPSKFRELFDICYGQDGTGNLYSRANIHSFRDVVRGRHPSGVDLVVADGGFLDARSQANQESMMTRLILAEVLTMFAVLRAGGDFVCKTFELATPAMQELCWVLHQCFERFVVVKPITSRPASSERYIVARDLRMGNPTAKLVGILEERLVESGSIDSTDAFELRFLTNTTAMRKDVDFLQYMTTANEAIARSQVQACRRINEFAANKNKRKTREADSAIDSRQFYHCWRLESTK
ncbi:hypothetical protein PRIC1_002073 [Phytophthora ramorum]